MLTMEILVERFAMASVTGSAEIDSSEQLTILCMQDPEEGHCRSMQRGKVYGWDFPANPFELVLLQVMRQVVRQVNCGTSHG